MNKDIKKLKEDAYSEEVAKEIMGALEYFGLSGTWGASDPMKMEL